MENETEGQYASERKAKRLGGTDWRMKRQCRIWHVVSPASHSITAIGQPPAGEAPAIGYGWNAFCLRRCGGRTFAPGNGVFANGMRLHVVRARSIPVVFDAAASRCPIGALAGCCSPATPPRPTNRQVVPFRLLRLFQRPTDQQPPPVPPDSAVLQFHLLPALPACER